MRFDRLRRNVGTVALIQTAVVAGLMLLLVVVPTIAEGDLVPLAAVLVGTGGGVAARPHLIGDPARSSRILGVVSKAIVVGAVIGSFTRDQLEALVSESVLLGGLAGVLALYLSSFVLFWSDPGVERVE